MKHGLSLDLHLNRTHIGTASGGIIQNVGAPVITGTPEIGQVLSASAGSWSGSGAVSFGYQWRRDGQDIIGASGPSYLVLPEDDGATLDVTVTATDANGSANASSASVSVTYPAPQFVQHPTLSPLNGPVGTVFTISQGSAEPNASLSVAEFALDGSSKLNEISGLTWDSSGQTPGDLLLRVSATNSGGQSFSNEISAVLEPALAAPGAFPYGGWDLSDDLSGGTLLVTLSAMAFDGGDTISDVEYRVDGGDWVSSGLTTLGSFQISNLTDEQSYSVAIRAVNSVGAGPASQAKTAVPTSPVIGGLETARFGVANSVGSGAYDTNGMATDGIYGAFSVNGGIITPDGSQTAGVYNVGGYPVEVSATVLAVATQAELDALGPGQFGLTLIVRVGATLKLNQLTGGFGANADMLRTVIIGDGPDPRLDYETAPQDASAHFDFVVLNKCANLTFKNLRCVPQNNSVNSTCIELIGGYSLTGPCIENIEISGCVLKTGNPDPFGDYSGGASSFPGGRGVLSQANMYPKGISIIDNVFYGHFQAIEVHATGQRYVEIVGNRIDMNYADFIKPGTKGETPLLIAGNYCSRPLGLGSDAGSPHPDIMQITGSNGLDSNIVLEANFFLSGQSRGLGGTQVWFFNSNSGAGVSGLIRGCGNIDGLVRSYSVYRANGFTVDYCASVPDDTSPVPYGGSEAGVRFESVVADVDIKNSFFGAVLTGSGISVPNTQELRSWSAGAATAALPAYPIANGDGPYAAHDVLALFQTAAAGALDGMGPGAIISLQAGDNLSQYSIDSVAAPTPTLTNLVVQPSGASFTATIKTDVDLNPVFWVVAPQTAVLPDAEDIKKQRVPGAMDYGYRRVLKGEGDSTTDIILTGTAGALQNGTNYRLFAFQENGWTRNSPVISADFTTP